MTQEAISPTSLSTETPAQIEIRRVNPTLALFIALDDLNINVLRVLEALERTRPQGRILPITRTVTTLIGEKLDPPWFSFHLVNDGPDELGFSINDRKGPFATLPAHESLDVDMVEASIGALYLQSGGTASIRAYGVY